MAENFRLPREVPLPRGFDICDGPATIFVGTTDFSVRWAAWVATDGIRIGAWNNQVMADDFGTVNGLFDPGVRPSKVTICFDNVSSPLIAIQSDATTIALRKYVADVPTEFTFAGLSPILFNNKPCRPDDSDYDIAVFYIKADGDVIYFRLNRDDFATEYTLNATLNTTITQLTKADAITFARGGDTAFYMALWAVDDQGREIFFRTDTIAVTGGSN